MADLKILLRAYIDSERTLNKLYQVEPSNDEGRIALDIDIERAKEAHYQAWDAYKAAIKEAAKVRS